MTLSKKRESFFAFITLALLAAVFYLMNMYTPLSFKDDLEYSFSYATGERLSSVKDVLTSQIAHYNIKNGRFVAHTTEQFLLCEGKSVFNIVNTLVYMLFGILVCYHGAGESPLKHPYMLVCVFCGFFLLTPWFGENLLWVSGACNYLMGFTISLLYLLPYRYVLEHPENRKNSLVGCAKFIAMFLLGAIAGNTMENAAVAIIAAVIGFLFVYRARGIRYRAWMFAPGVLVGFALLLLSPGEMSRVSAAGGISAIGICRDFVTTSMALVVHFYTLILIAAGIISMYSIYGRARDRIDGETKLERNIRRWGAAEVYMLAALAATYSMIIVPGGIGIYSRVWFGPLTFYIISVSAGYLSVEEYAPMKWSKAKELLVYILAFATLTTGAQGIWNIRGRFIENEQRNRLIQEQMLAGEEEIHIPAISSTSTFSIYFGGGEHLYYDAERNRNIAKYYGLPSVVRDDSIELPH